MFSTPVLFFETSFFRSEKNQKVDELTWSQFKLQLFLVKLLVFAQWLHVTSSLLNTLYQFLSHFYAVSYFSFGVESKTTVFTHRCYALYLPILYEHGLRHQHLAPLNHSLQRVRRVWSQKFYDFHKPKFRLRRTLGKEAEISIKLLNESLLLVDLCSANVTLLVVLAAFKTTSKVRFCTCWLWVFVLPHFTIDFCFLSWRPRSFERTWLLKGHVSHFKSSNLYSKTIWA